MFLRINVSSLLILKLLRIEVLIAPVVDSLRIRSGAAHLTSRQQVFRYERGSRFSFYFVSSCFLDQSLLFFLSCRVVSLGWRRHLLLDLLGLRLCLCLILFLPHWWSVQLLEESRAYTLDVGLDIVREDLIIEESYLYLVLVS